MSVTYPGEGKFRIKPIGERPPMVRVRDRNVAVDLDERTYRERGYLPDLEELPWQEP